LDGDEDFVCERKNRVVDAFENMGGVRGFRGSKDSTSYIVDNSGCAKDGIVENLGDYSKVSCSSQVWSRRWRCR